MSWILFPQKFFPSLTISSLHMVEVRIQYGCQSSSVEAHQDWPTHGHKAPDLPPSIHIRHNQIMSWSVLSHPVKTVKLFPYSQGSSESSYIKLCWDQLILSVEQPECSLRPWDCHWNPPDPVHSSPASPPWSRARLRISPVKFDNKFLQDLDFLDSNL